MKNTKSLLALIMALVLMLGIFPVTALAAKNDEVTYNLLDRPVTVGTGENPYDGDGSYTIRLEDDAFFPYEVQFTWNGKSESRWFMTAEDVVTVGGHDFRVVSERKDPNALMQLGMVVDGDYIPVYPEAKIFTASPAASTASLLPIKEQRLTVDLTDRPWMYEELENTVFSFMFGDGSTDIDGERKVMIAESGHYYYEQNHDYERYLGECLAVDALDMRYIGPFDYYANPTENVKYDMIVGTGNQLDKNNRRYTVELTCPISYYNVERFNFQAYLEGEDGKRVNVSPFNDRVTGPRDHESMAYMPTLLTTEQLRTGKIYVELSIDDEIFSRPDLTFSVTNEWPGLDTDVTDITDQILNLGDISQKGGYDTGIYSSDDDDLDGSVAWITVEVKKGDKTLIKELVDFYIEKPDPWLVDYGIYLYCEDDSARTNCLYSIQSYKNGSMELELLPGLPAEGEYYASIPVEMTYDGIAVDYSSFDRRLVTKSVVGAYTSLDEAKDQPDITDQLFSDASKPGGGYKADYSKGVTFTVFWNTDYLVEYRDYDYEQITIKTVDYQMSSGEYLSFTGAAGLDAYVMPRDHDTYYSNGFQTVFLLNRDGSAVDAEEITPTFYSWEGARIFLGEQGNGGQLQQSGVSEVPFRSGQALAYTASAGDGESLKNYWVTFLTRQTGGPKLFVNGLNAIDPETGEETAEREIFFTDLYDYKHDIFFANIGDEPMRNIKVELVDPVNVTLDSYWTVQDGAIAELAPFDTTERRFTSGDFQEEVWEGELQNVAKIRLLPDPENRGEISGKLVISADGVEPVEIKLTGISRMPQIVTENLDGGVKFVHYSNLIQTNSMYVNKTPWFSLESGQLPDGLTLRSDGEIYGIPTKTGTFTFTVKASCGTDEYDTREYTITISNNTSDNVESQTSTGYELVERVPDVIERGRDYTLRSMGEYEYFVQVAIDGTVLGMDQYTASEGSTVITIDAQTFGSFGGGSHTISAEFREGGEDGDMKVAAQNYSLNIPSPGPSVGPGTPGTPSKPSEPVKPNEPSEPSQPQIPEEGFLDVKEGDWFYEDVMWASGEKLMVGIGGGLFAPYTNVSAAMVVTVLARLSGDDLTVYTGANEDILPGMWYSASALWARDKGILTGRFDPDETVQRGKMAVMLSAYLKNVEGVTDEPEDGNFPDGDLMTPEERDAFNLLCARKIFIGVDESGRMDPSGLTSRGQLATLLHRLNGEEDK